MIDNVPVRILINAQDKASGVFNKLKSNAGKVAAAIVGYFGVRFFGSAIDDAEALQTQIGTLEAIIKSTGGTAGLTAEEIVQMSKRLDEQTLGSAEGFRTASASLLTFKSVSKDAFETTLALAQDLATAGFGTLETNTIQLGKALEDPVQGLNALKRSGVSFTESQKDLIKSLVETGDKAKAQEIILKALTDQVGGAGAGAGGGLSGAIDLVGKRFQDFKEQLGTGMLKPLTQANGLIADFLKKLNNTGAAKAFGDFIGNAFSFVLDKSIDLYDNITRIYTVLSESGAIQNFSNRWNNALDSIIDLSNDVIDIIKDISSALFNSSAIDKFRQQFKQAFDTSIELSKNLLGSFKILFDLFDDTSSVKSWGEILGSILVGIIQSVTVMVSGFTTGLAVIETAFHATGSIISSFLSSFVSGVAAIQEAISKITTGNLSKSFAEDAAKSRLIAESFAQSMQQSNDKAAAALEKTADSSVNTRNAMRDLFNTSNQTSQATNNLTQQQNNLAVATGGVVEPMHRLRLSTVEVDAAQRKAANSAETLTYFVDGVAHTLDKSTTAGLSFGDSLDSIADSAKRAGEELNIFQQNANDAAAQQQHFNDILQQEADIREQGRRAEAADQKAKDAATALRNAPVSRDLSAQGKEDMAKLTDAQRLELQQLINDQARKAGSGGVSTASVEDLIRLLLLRGGSSGNSPTQVPQTKSPERHVKVTINNAPPATFDSQNDADEFIKTVKTSMGIT